MGISKVCVSCREAVHDISDGATIMVGGFAGPGGTPSNLIRALWEQGAKDLTVISNNCGGLGQEDPFMNLGLLFQHRRVRKAIVSYPITVSPLIRGNAFAEQYLSGQVELELVPQGTLAERIRAGGAGIPGFYTPVGAGTELAEGKESRTFDEMQCLLERGLQADFALIKARRGDYYGNLVYQMAARNFGPVMATAARMTIAEVDEIVKPGELDPEAIVTPSIYVSRLVQVSSQLSTEFAWRPAQKESAHQPRLYNAKPGLPRDVVSMRVAQELKGGDYVNLGHGLPALAAAHIPADVKVFLHAENGVLGYGPFAPEEQRDYNLVNASGLPVTLAPGVCFFHHADSFAMIRGGHLDVAVLGALQVSENGDLANWKVPGRQVPGVGGGMDLAVGAKRVIVAMEHVDKTGNSKVVKQCTMPLTATRCVHTIITDLAVLEVTRQGLLLKEVAPGFAPDEVQQFTEARLRVDQNWKEMRL